MQSLDALKLTHTSVGPRHPATSVRELLQGTGLRAVAVVEEGRLLGIASRERLAAAPENAEVIAVMESPRTTLDGGTSVRRAAEIFVEADLDYAPVVKGGRFLGILTAAMLLREMSRSWDPLTGLSYSDRLREWGAENLTAGMEITILFLDLDDFGQFNKRFGHIVGDKVLRRVATALREVVDPQQDVLVRYGGDEFALGTLRRGSALSALTESVRQKMAGLTLGETGEPIGFSLGWHGGKRTRERDSVHFAATLDDLINLASRDCLRQKRPQGQGILLESLPELEEKR